MWFHTRLQESNTEPVVSPHQQQRQKRAKDRGRNVLITPETPPKLSELAIVIDSKKYAPEPNSAPVPERVPPVIEKLEPTDEVKRPATLTVPEVVVTTKPLGSLTTTFCTVNTLVPVILTVPVNETDPPDKSMVLAPFTTAEGRVNTPEPDVRRVPADNCNAGIVSEPPEPNAMPST